MLGSFLVVQSIVYDQFDYLINPLIALQVPLDWGPGQKRCKKELRFCNVCGRCSGLMVRVLDS